MKIEEQFTSVLNDRKTQLEEELVKAKTGFADGMLKKAICADDVFSVATNARNVEVIEGQLTLMSQIKADFAQVCAAALA